MLGLRRTVFRISDGITQRRHLRHLTHPSSLMEPMTFGRPKARKKAPTMNSVHPQKFHSHISVKKYWGHGKNARTRMMKRM